MPQMKSPYNDLQFTLECTSHEYVKLRVISTKRDADSEVILVKVELDLTGVPQ